MGGRSSVSPNFVVIVNSELCWFLLQNIKFPQDIHSISCWQSLISISNWAWHSTLNSTMLGLYTNKRTLTQRIHWYIFKTCLTRKSCDLPMAGKLVLKSFSRVWGTTREGELIDIQLQCIYPRYNLKHVDAGKSTMQVDVLMKNKKIRKKHALPETNSSPLRIGHPNRKLIFQPSILQVLSPVSFREGMFFSIGTSMYDCLSSRLLGPRNRWKIHHHQGCCCSTPSGRRLARWAHGCGTNTENSGWVSYVHF